MKNQLRFILLIVAIAGLAIATNANATNTAAENTVISAVANAPDVGADLATGNDVITLSTGLENAAPAAAVDIGLVNRFTNSTSSSINVTVDLGFALAPDVGAIMVSINNSTNSALVKKTVTYGANMARDVGLANSFNNLTNSTKAANAITDVDIGSIKVSISS